MQKGLVAISWLLLLFARGTPSEAGLIQPGDLSFIGFNADGQDDFAIVLLADAESGTVVRFTDREWMGTAFNTGEGSVSWILTQDLRAGTVVVFSNVDSMANPNFGPSTGSLSGSLLLAVGGETLYAFLGPSSTQPTTFLAAISTLPSDYQGSTGTLDGTGLVLGTTAVLLSPGTRGGQYAGSRADQSAFSSYLPLIGDVAENWVASASQGTAVLPFNTTPFATPEPATWSLAAMAMAAVSAAMRRERMRRSRSGDASFSSLQGTSA